MTDKTVDAIKIKLFEGKRYSFCRCGLSKNLTYCDNAHRVYNEKEGTDYKSLKIFAKEDTEVLVYSAAWKR